MNPEENLQRSILAQLPGAETKARCKNITGMWIIEIVDPLQDKRGRSLLEILQQILKGNSLAEDIWKIFLYKSAADRFIMNGTLHTLPMEYHYGMPSVTLSANDAYIDMTAFDVEIMLLEVPPGLEILARSSRSDTGGEILPIRSSVKYKWLESQGTEFRLDPGGVTDQHDGTYLIRLATREDR